MEGSRTRQSPPIHPRRVALVVLSIGKTTKHALGRNVVTFEEAAMRIDYNLLMDSRVAVTYSASAICGAALPARGGESPGRALLLV